MKHNGTSLKNKEEINTKKKEVWAYAAFLSLFFPGGYMSFLPKTGEINRITKNHLANSLPTALKFKHHIRKCLFAAISPISLSNKLQ